MQERSRRLLLAYGAALPALVLGIVARWHLEGVLGERALYSTFFPAVMIAAYFGGLWPGLIVMCAGTIAGNLMGAPRFTLGIKGPGDTTAMLLFVLTSAIITGLCESLHRAHRRILAEERLRAAEARRETEDRFRQIVENIQEIFWISDASYEQFLFVSPVHEQIYGRKIAYESPSTAALLEGVHPDDRDAVRRNIEERRRGEFGNVLEYRIVRPDGSVRWLRSRAFPVYDPGGNLARITGLAADITDLKRTEDSLREGERRFRTFVDHATDAFFLFDDQNVLVDVNQQACRSLDYAREEMLGMTVHDFDPDFTVADEQDQTRVLVAGGNVAFESRHRRKDGTIFPVEISGQSFWEGGRRFTIALARDITERMRAEFALRESEERFRGTFENAAVGIGHLNIDGGWIRVNQRLCDITGYTREELLGKTFQEITYPDDVRASVEPFTRLWDGAVASYSLEKRYVRKDGSQVWIETTVSLKRDADGRPTNTIAVIQDISVRRRLEGELRRAKESAESANRAKDEFLANVSHEIRTPMNAILGMTELVLDTPLIDDQRQSLVTVKSAADNLLGIINDLLDFSKIEAGKLELDPAEFSLRATVGDTLRALAVRADRKALKLVCNIEPIVPDCLVGDAGRLRQILLNVVGNAIKFTDRGEVVVQVDVAPQPSGRADGAGDVTLSFTVRDTGIGIPAEKQSTIFRAFEQEDMSTTRKYGGTGLGLTISSQLAALMGGSIAVQSEPGRGSTFFVTAPFGLASERPPVDVLDGARVPAPDIDAQAEPSHPIATPVMPLRVLVAEDNDFNAYLMEKLLSKRGHSVRVVGNGREVLELARTTDFDLLLLDIHMPEMDGFQVIRGIRDRERMSGTHLPVIALTARSRKEDLELCLAAGMDAYLSKPLRADDLWVVIDRVTETPRRAVVPSDALLAPDVLLAACGGDEKILTVICEGFVANSPRQIAAIREALRECDAPRLREAAHKWSGMVSVFSTLAGGLASDLEDLAMQGRLDGADSLVDRIGAAETQILQLLANGLTIRQLRQAAGVATPG